MPVAVAPLALTRRHAVAVLALGLAAPLARADAASQRREWPRGRAAPALDLPGPGGTRWQLESARGKVVLLNFWASWCAPCLAEMPSLELLAQRQERDGLLVKAVNYRETDAAMRRFLATMPLTLDILRDADGAATRAWGVRIFPSTIAIARDGTPTFSVVGELDWAGAQARDWITPLLAAPHP